MKRTCLLVLAFLLVTAPAWAALTAAQKQTLKTDILADPSALAFYTNGDLTGLAGYYNAAASPSFTVWRSNVSIGEVGRTFNANDLAGLSSLNTQRLQNLAQWLVTGVNPSLASVRQFFDDIFSGAGGSATRTALLAIWKRLATRAEKVFATGTGSDASPASLGFEGAVSANDLIGL